MKKPRPRKLARKKPAAKKLTAGKKPAGKKPAAKKPAAKKLDFYAHPTAVIDDGAQIGAGTKIWHFSHVMSGARIGAGCSLGQNVFVASHARTGNNCKLQNNVSVYDGVVLGHDVFVGPSAVFTNVINPRSSVIRKDEYRATIVENGVSIGANATIVCGHVLGTCCFVAAGAVVTRDVPAYALMAGVPARRIGWMCRCGVTLPKVHDAGTDAARLVCKACGASYEVAHAAEGHAELHPA